MSKTDLSDKEVDLDRKEIEKTKLLVGTKDKKTVGGEKKRTVLFRTLNVSTGKIANALTNNIQEGFNEGKNEIMFITRSNNMVRWRSYLKVKK